MKTLHRHIVKLLNLFEMNAVFFSIQSKLRLIGLLFSLFSLNPFCSAASYPALPQIFIDSKYTPPTMGRLFSVKTSAEFQSALNSSNLGDIIEMQAGNVFTGPFTLPNKTSGNGWIYIRTSLFAKLPSPCSRVSPSDAENMPKIVVNAGSGGTINTVPNSHHYRFIGIEFKPIEGKFLYNIIQIGNNEKTETLLPNNIVFDRCYIHGDAEAGSRRGVMMNGAYISVIDSYISDCKESGADSQALGAWSSPGPIKIVNNYLEGAGENILFGGADPSIPNCVTSDIEIRYNYFFKPLSWIGSKWSVKNLLEFKNAQRVLVEGNKFENNWPNAQNGFALLITPRNQNNTAPWSVARDITIRFNKFMNIAAGVNLSGYDSPNKSERTSRILIQNNFWEVKNVGTGTNGRLFQILNGSTDVIIDHNTGFCNSSYIVADGSPKTDNFVFTNNIVNFAQYGFIGTGTANANTTLSTFFNPNWTVTNNAVIGGTSNNYPSGNFFPSNNNSVGFSDFSGNVFNLATSSPYKGRATDGKDLGADIDSLALMAIYNCDSITSNLTDDEKLIGFIEIYPNPASDFIIISSIDKVSKVEFYSLSGVKIFESENKDIIDLSLLPEGIYIIKQNNKTRRFIKY